MARLVLSVEESSAITAHVLVQFVVRLLRLCPHLLTDKELSQMPQDLERCLESMENRIGQMCDIIANVTEANAKQHVALLQSQFSMRSMELAFQLERRVINHHSQQLVGLLDYCDQQIQDRDQQIQDRDQQIQHLKAEVCRQEVMLVDISKACQQHESNLEITRERNELMMRTLEVQRRDGVCQASLEDKVRSLNVQLATVQEEKVKLMDKKMEELTVMSNELMEEKSIHEEEVARYEVVVAELTKEKDKFNESQKEEVARHGVVVAELTKEKDKLTTTNESLKEEVARLNTVIAGMGAEMKELTERNYRMVKSNEVSEDKMKQLTKHNETLNLEVTELQEKNAGLAKMTESQGNELETLMKRLHVEKEMTKLCEEESSALRNQVRVLNSLSKKEIDASSARAEKVARLECAVSELKCQLLQVKEGEPATPATTCIDRHAEQETDEDQLKLELRTVKIEKNQLAAEIVQLNRRLEEQKDYYENELLIMSRGETQLWNRIAELLKRPRRMAQEKEKEEKRTDCERQYNPGQPNLGGIPSNPDSGLPTSRDMFKSSQGHAFRLSRSLSL